MSATLGWCNSNACGGLPEKTRAKPIVGNRLRLAAFFAAVIAAAIALHLFNPTHWPALAVDILHSLHGSGFAVLALAIYWYLQGRFPTSNNYLLAAVITMSIGVLSEIAQIPGPRDAQVSDLVVDGLGIFGAIGMLAAFDKQLRQKLNRSLRILLPGLAGIALAIACVPSIWLSWALLQQQLAFPELLTFEHAWERATFSQTAQARPQLVAAPESWPVAGDTVAHAAENGRWGIFISLHPQQDWRGYEQLSFVAASVGESFAMDIGVRDIAQQGEYHGARYYKSVTVGPQPRRYSVSFEEIETASTDRPFNFALLESVVLSAAKPGNNAELLVDDFRVER